MSALAASLALLLGAGSATPHERVEVLLLTKLHPREAELVGKTRVRVSAHGEELRVAGAPAAQPLALEEATWSVRVSGQPPRFYRGRLEVRAKRGELILVADLALEDYVAEVVASEALPGTPAASLRAQAIVSRSWILSQGRRHGEAAVCDLAHCQVLRGTGDRRHREAARRATVETAGVVLRLRSGEIAQAAFHAACGGHTADPKQFFGGEDRTGAAPVADPGCRAPWSAELTEVAFRRAAGKLFASGGPVPRPEELALKRGAGGFVNEAVDPVTGTSVPGDALARALDAETGFRGVRSARLWIERSGRRVLVRGSGLGHGVGLCQSGAARLALRGMSEPEILRRFFPKAHLNLLARH